MPETADTELQFPANFLKSFEISIQRRQNFSISCNNLVKLAMSFSTHQFLTIPAPLGVLPFFFAVSEENAGTPSCLRFTDDSFSVHTFRKSQISTVAFSF